MPSTPCPGGMSMTLAETPKIAEMAEPNGGTENRRDGGASVGMLMDEVCPSR